MKINPLRNTIVMDRINMVAKRFGLPNMSGSQTVTEDGCETVNLGFVTNVPRTMFTESFPKELKRIFGIKRLVLEGEVY